MCSILVSAHLLGQRSFQMHSIAFQTIDERVYLTTIIDKSFKLDFARRMPYLDETLNYFHPNILLILPRNHPNGNGYVNIKQSGPRLHEWMSVRIPLMTLEYQNEVRNQIKDAFGSHIMPLIAEFIFPEIPKDIAEFTVEYEPPFWKKWFIGWLPLIVLFISFIVRYFILQLV